MPKNVNRNTFKSSIDSVTDEIISSVSNISGDAAKETEIAKKLSDKIECVSGKNERSLVGALHEGKASSYDYAMAMNYFCNALGIECITVTGTENAWNRVKLDGKWYEADVSMYDAPEHTEAYDDSWLNKSTATFKANGSEDSHVVATETTMFSGITLPDCSEDYVEEVDVPALPKITVSPLKAEQMFLGKQLMVQICTGCMYSVQMVLLMKCLFTAQAQQ